MENSTPRASLLGGVLIGLSAAAMLLFNGRIVGISGIIGGLLRPTHGETLWRAVFVVGLITGGFIMAQLTPRSFDIGVSRSAGALLCAGLLVGFGTRLGNGCTSGHGVCGISRGSVRSLVATAVFMATGGAVVYFVNHILRGTI